jgi:hypothetical protein
MKDIDNGKTDSDLADKIADLVYDAVSSGVVSTNDEGDIEGASGEGTIS